MVWILSSRLCYIHTTIHDYGQNANCIPWVSTSKMWICSSFTLLIKYRTGWLKDISIAHGTRRRWYISASTTNNKRKLQAAFFYSLQLSLGTSGENGTAAMKKVLEAEGWGSGLRTWLEGLWNTACKVSCFTSFGLFLINYSSILETLIFVAFVMQCIKRLDQRPHLPPCPNYCSSLSHSNTQHNM